MSAAEPTARTAPRWLVVAVAGVFALLYAYVFWAAIGFLAQQAGGTQGLTLYGWIVLLLPVVFAPLAFVGAFLVGRRRGLLALAAVLLTGLALTAVLWLDVFEYAAGSPSLYA